MASEAQSYVTSALEDLKLKAASKDMMGGPVEYEVTKETAQLFTEGTTVIVGSDGKLTVKES